MKTEDAEVILDELLSKDISGWNANLCLAGSPGSDKADTFQRVNLTTELALDFREEIAEARLKGLKKAKAEGDLRLLEYQKGAQLDEDEIEFVENTEVPNLSTAVASLTKLVAMPPFASQKAFISALRYYSLVIELPGALPVIFFRQYTAARQINRKRNHFSVHLIQGGEYDRLREPLFTFDHSVDCVSYRGVTFVLSKTRFHQIFRFFEELSSDALKMIDELSDTGLLSQMDEMRAMSESNFMFKKRLAFIQGQDYIANLTIDALKTARERLPESDKAKVVIVKDRDGKETIQFSADSRYAVLKMLSDSILHSPMTNNDYEVKSKRLIKRTQGSEGQARLD